MDKFAYGLFGRWARNKETPKTANVASKNTIKHTIRSWTPFMIRTASTYGRWGILVLATLLYFGQPRKYFQYIPFFGRYYNPKGRYLADHLE